MDNDRRAGTGATRPSKEPMAVAKKKQAASAARSAAAKAKPASKPSAAKAAAAAVKPAAKTGNGKPPEAPPLPKDVEIDAYRQMLLIRRFEEKAGQMYGMGLIGGFCHLYIGQEAVVVGMQLAVKEWRIRFSVDGRAVRVIDIASGFRVSQLAGDANDEMLQSHREFRERYVTAR